MRDIIGVVRGAWMVAQHVKPETDLIAKSVSRLPHHKQDLLSEPQTLARPSRVSVSSETNAVHAVISGPPLESMIPSSQPEIAIELTTVAASTPSTAYLVGSSVSPATEQPIAIGAADVVSATNSTQIVGDLKEVALTAASATNSNIAAASSDNCGSASASPASDLKSAFAAHTATTTATSPPPPPPPPSTQSPPFQTTGTASKQFRERKVPASAASRAAGFGGLAVGLAMGAVGEFTKRMLRGCVCVIFYYF